MLIRIMLFAPVVFLLFQLSSFFDGGWTVKIGDELNGFSNVAECMTLDEVVEFLKTNLV